jgi:hypothetical protein
MSYADRPLFFLELLPEALGRDLQRRHAGVRDSRRREARRRRLEGEAAPRGSCAPNGGRGLPCGGLQRAGHARWQLPVAQLRRRALR